MIPELKENTVSECELSTVVKLAGCLSHLKFVSAGYYCKYFLSAQLCGGVNIKRQLRETIHLLQRIFSKLEQNSAGGVTDKYFIYIKEASLRFHSQQQEIKKSKI